MSVKPTIAVTLGDPAGIGPELVARLLVEDEVREQAQVLVIGDEWLLEQGQHRAGLSPAWQTVAGPEALDGHDIKMGLLAIETVDREQVLIGQASAAGGRSVLAALRSALDLAQAGRIDAIVYAPLNKHAMHLAKFKFEDELRWMAAELDHQGPVGEINVVDRLWTTRVTSHVPLAAVPALITCERILEAVELAHDALSEAGLAAPRLGVAGLNPHAGEGGNFGRDEIDLIAPAIEEARARGMCVEGPISADTIFVKARAGEYDAVITMYHDQGQIAMKLMGFERGVTVQGGLPLPVTTPAQGSAYDIAGKGVASVEAMREAFLLACRMGAARAAGRKAGVEVPTRRGLPHNNDSAMVNAND